MKWLLLGIIVLVVGCASEQESLQREYDLYSQRIDALTEERKSLLNLKIAAENYLQAKEKYTKKKEVIHKIREQNSDKGLDIGPDFDEGDDVEKQITVIQKNDDIISQQLSKLKKHRNAIIKKLNASP